MDTLSTGQFVYFYNINYHSNIQPTHHD